MRGPFYSEIPPNERSEWGDGDLSGAIWDEGMHRLGNEVSARTVSQLPFGYRAVLAEGLTRAHVEGDGLPTAIWNDNGADMFALAAHCHRVLGSAQLADLLEEIVQAVDHWQQRSDLTPRSLDVLEFTVSPLGRRLESFAERFDALAPAGFESIMRFLRQHPEQLS